MRNRRRLFSLMFALIVPLLVLGGLLMTLSSETATADSPEPAPPQPNQLLQAIRQGKYPAQLAGHSGAIRPDRYGPQRNDPAEGIPAHAYSPFDEARNREYPCPPGGCEFQKGQVLVKLSPQVRLRGPELKGAWTENATLNEVLQAQGVLRLEPIFPNARPPKPGEFVVSPQGERLPKPDLTRWYRAVLTNEKADVYAVVQALSETPGIAWAEPDYLRRPVGGPAEQTSSRPETGPLALPGSSTDPLYDQQWHLSATNVPQAWQWLEDNGYTPGGSRDIVVAVIDTGVDYTHPDLAANMWVNSAEFSGSPGVDDDGNGYVDDIYGADTVYPDGDPIDDHGHGTHVAGIVAAQAFNNEGGVGVAYNVQLMALKAAQYSGVLASSDIAEAIYYAVEKGADVLNMSFGGYARSQVEEDALAVAFGQAVLVAAAGNDAKVNLPCPFGRDMYPAAYNWVLGVMARNQYPNARGDYLASFSNFDCWLQDSHEYELMAPGVDVWSTLPNGQYAAWDGTSMATPVVSGIAALARTKWSDKDVYSSRFIMGQLATTGGKMQAYTPLGSLPVFYYVPDALAALTTTPKPKLSYLEHWTFDTPTQSLTNDDDGIVDAGETIDLAIVIRNHWGKADPVTVTLEAWAEGAVYPDPYVTMITDTVNYGAIGSFNQDDNGLIYDAQGVIVGVRHPFRFSVDPNTPNDHVIPFRLTMTARNGLDPTDTTVYTFFPRPRFDMMVQRGRELPRIISQDMVLSKDYYWLVPDQTLIEGGVTVTVTGGTQIQFGSVQPDDPYSLPTDPRIEIQGEMLAVGTFSEPIELFAGDFHPDKTVRVSGAVDLSYVLIDKPELDVLSTGHCYFSASTAAQVPYHKGYDIKVSASGTISQCIFHKMRGASEIPDEPFFANAQSLDSNLFDRGVIGSRPFDLRDLPQVGWRPNRMPTSASDNVFLNNWTTSQWGQVLVSTLAFPTLTMSQTSAINNAFLNPWINPNVNYWLWILADSGVPPSYLQNNYWGTQSDTLISYAIYDYNDDFSRGKIIYQPFLTNPPETAYPFVVDVTLSTASQSGMSALNGPTPIVGAEMVTFTVTFNRDMDTTVHPSVSFGPDVPETDYTIHPVDGGWQDARTWAGTFNVTPITGDGYQLMRIAGAVAADDPWLVTGDDSERFRFEIITSGTEAMNLQATGGEGYVDLMWTQDDFDLLAGFNLYRSTSQDGTYTRINDSIIPPDQRTYRDTNVQPGQPYYYKFTVVKTDMTESDFSNVATATPVDTIPPVISHTPVTQAPPGLPLTLFADVTDNVGVQSVTLYYRQIGATSYASKAMVKTTGNRYSATIEGAKVTSPGLEYYIEATDGISPVRFGRPENPYQILVVDRPVVTTVSPNRGPASGGTNVTIAGSNFKAGATVAFGGAVASNVTVVSSSQITCTTPPHYPATVDVKVTNPDSQSGTLLRGFTYESDVASLSLPNTGGGQHAIVQVPVNAANVQGLAAADLTITFDQAVLSARDASTGNLTPGWSVVANTNTPGEIRVSMASPGGTVSGSGVLAYLEFEVMGSPGDSTALQLTNTTLNDGAILVETAEGSFTVNLVYYVSGTVRLWNGGAGVPGALFSLVGDRVYTGLSDANGAYTVSGAETDDYSLTPSKSDGVNGISAYDTSLVLQHSAGLTTLTGHAATAADVNKSGIINSMDAFYVLQKAVDLITLPFPGAGVVWDFDPPSQSYSNLNSDVTGQDFTAVLLGDVSGNWSAGVGQALLQLANTASLTLPHLYAESSERITITLDIALDQAEVYGADIVLGYDPAVVTAISVSAGDVAQDFLIASNLNQPGQIRVAIANAESIADNGNLLALVFDVVGELDDTSPLQITAAELNEGSVIAQRQDGSVEVVDFPDYDFNRDCNVDVVDIMRVASRWRCRSGDGCYVERYDIDKDGDIDIVDIMLVVTTWGSTCP